ncbi:MAG: carboxypeptidase-like regulatory domain-containing protein [Planctomycetota bacterium]|jgi:hypothetical protein
MRANVLWSALVLIGIFAVSLTASAEPVLFDLDGREAVVLVYRNRGQPRKRSYEKITVTIRGRMVKAEVADANESMSFHIGLGHQKDEVVRQVLAGHSYGWYYGKDPDFEFPYSPAELDGREVVVRLYNDPAAAPGEFEKAVVKASQQNVRFDFDEADESAVVAVFIADQKDEVVKEALRNRVYSWNYKKGLTFELTREWPAKYDHYSWIFADADRNILSHATIEVYLAARRPSRQIFIGKTTLGEDAKIDFPVCAADEDAHVTVGKHRTGFSPGKFRFKISHPDYETVAVVAAGRKKYRPEQSATIYAPMLMPGSELEPRGIWGVVVDDQGHPLEGVVVRSGSITPPGGKSLHCTVARQTPGVLTDSAGRFRFYPGVRWDVEAIGPVIPAGSEYSVIIKPPEGSGLKQFRGDVIIRMERLEEEEKYFHTFAFEDENGPVTQYKRLRCIDIGIERDGKSIDFLSYSEWSQGGDFPLGVYKARYSHPQSTFEFLPVEVTKDSPEQLSFRTVSGEKKYYGQVVHGVTGEPMEGVFVQRVRGGGHDPSELSEKDWPVLHALPRTARNEKEAAYWVRSIVRMYELGRMVRTDSQGRFQIYSPAKSHVYKLSIYEQGYLLIHVENDLFEKDIDGNYRVPVTRMFPSAKIVIDPWSHAKGRNSPQNFHPNWIVDVERSPSWAKGLLAACIDDYREGIFRDYNIDSNRGLEVFHVPAGVTFDLQLRPWSPFSRDPTIWSSMTLGRDLNLKQGQVLDLGRIEIKRVFNVFAEVQRSTGEPVEGLPVKACDQYGQIISNTDHEGVAMFSVARDSQGEFVVEYKPPEPETALHLRESVPYQITGPEDANSVYEFSVSDKMIYQLLK